MGLFRKQKAEPATETKTEPEISCRTVVDETIQLLDWTVETAAEEAWTLWVPKKNNIRMRCDLKRSDVMVHYWFDAGIRIPLDNVRYPLAYVLLEENTHSLYGSYRVAPSRNELIITYGGYLDYRIFRASYLAPIITFAANRFHDFLERMIRRGLLAFPVHFLGFQSDNIPISREFKT